MSYPKFTVCLGSGVANIKSAASQLVDPNIRNKYVKM
jgi:hypothetical protein